MTSTDALRDLLVFELAIDSDVFRRGGCRPYRGPDDSVSAQRAMLAYRMRNPPPGWQTPSYPEIARSLGYRSHSSALAACRRHAAFLERTHNMAARIIPAPASGQVWRDVQSEFRVTRVKGGEGTFTHVTIRRANGHERELRGHEWNRLASRSALVSEPAGRTRGTSERVLAAEGARLVPAGSRKAPASIVGHENGAPRRLDGGRRSSPDQRPSGGGATNEAGG